MAKLENKTRDISQMLNNLNKITTTPVKKKNNEAPKPVCKNNELKSEEPKNQNNGDEIKIVVDQVQESKTAE